MNIEWARNIGGVILMAGALIMSFFVASTDVKSWVDKNSGYVGREEQTKNNAIMLRIAAIWLIVVLMFVGVALVHFT